MAYRNPCWKRLGIAPTGDTRAIRKAYAGRLKTIDVDADPQAFIELREAFDAAMREAQWHVEGEGEEDEPLADEEIEAPSGADAPAMAGVFAQAPAPVEPARPEPWREITPAQADAQAQSLTELLYSLAEAGALPNRSQRAAMLDDWRVIAADPRMQQVAFYGDAEVWASELIARTVPFSDPLVEPVVEHFGWMQSAGTIAQSPAIAFLIRRKKLLGVAATLDAPDNKLHAAWRELRTPAHGDSRRGRRVRERDIRALLALFRRDYPELMHELDPIRVALWEPIDPGAGGGGGELLRFLIWPGLLVIWMIIRAAGSLGPSHPAPSPYAYAPPPIATSTDAPPAVGVAPDQVPRALLGPEVADTDADIAAALTMVGDGNLRWAEVKQRNPKLAQLLRSNWLIARDEHASKFVFAARMASLLKERYRLTVRLADYPIVAEYRRLLRDKAQALLARSPAECDRFLRGQSVTGNAFPPEIQRRESALMTRELLASRDPPAGIARTIFYTTPAVDAAAARAAGLTRERLDAALNLRGTPAEHCRGRIALTDVALSLPPKEGLKLLREM